MRQFDVAPVDLLNLAGDINCVPLPQQPKPRIESLIDYDEHMTIALGRIVLQMQQHALRFVSLSPTQLSVPCHLDADVVCGYTGLLQ